MAAIGAPLKRPMRKFSSLRESRAEVAPIHPRMYPQYGAMFNRRLISSLSHNTVVYCTILCYTTFYHVIPYYTILGGLRKGGFQSTPTRIVPRGSKYPIFEVSGSQIPIRDMVFGTRCLKYWVLGPYVGRNSPHFRSAAPGAWRSSSSSARARWSSLRANTR